MARPEKGIGAQIFLLHSFQISSVIISIDLTERLMAEAHKRKGHPKYRKKYRKKYKVRNWSEYDRSLRSRGDLTIWLSEEIGVST